MINMVTYTNQLTIPYIVKVAKLTRQVVLGKKSAEKHGYLQSYNFINAVKNECGLKVLYTDSNSFDCAMRWDNNLKIPVIYLTRELSLDRQIYCLAYELGCLLLFWKWLPHKDMQDDAKQYASKQDWYLSVLPSNDKIKSAKCGLFAIVFLDII